MLRGTPNSYRKRPGMVRNIRHFFQHSEETQQELHTLRCIVIEPALGRSLRGCLEKDTAEQ